MKEKIFNYLLTIPKGKVVTYGRIGEMLGNKKLARYIGNVIHNNPNGDKYPCYKVVNSIGKLSEAYAFGGIEFQKKRLQADGIIVNNNKVNLEVYGWDGNE